MNKISLLSTFIFFYLITLKLAFAGNIINDADHEYWRNLATKSELFIAMKNDAVNNKTDLSLDVLGASSLAYIVDPMNKKYYLDKLKDELDNRVSQIRIRKGAATSSVPSHILFHALIALDVIRNDIPLDERLKYEKMLKDKIFSLYTKKWRPHATAMQMMWYKYIGDIEKFEVARQQFDFESEDANFLSDGVCKSQNGYCVQRFNSRERAAKNQVFDILEYMGYHNYYNWAALRKSYEFIYGWANAPFGGVIFYGDSRGGSLAWDVKDREILSPTNVRAGRFSQDAYKWSMWLLKEGAGLNKPVLKGYLASYIIMAGSSKQNNPINFNINDAELAPSKVLTNYALLVGNKQSRLALYGSIMSLDGVHDYHTHHEANAIALGGYGEHILRNAGYNGPNKSVSAGGLTTAYSFLSRNSESANTLMIGGENHSTRHGNGMVEGIVNTNIEYVRALNNRSISGTHYRDLIFMQAADGVNGYYIVMDHATTNKANEFINLVWHPNTATINTVKDKQEYDFEIKRKVGSAGPVLFSWEDGQRVDTKIFMGTAPTKVEKKEMVNQWRDETGEHHYRAEYLYTTYPTKDKQADILTIIFPGDQEHAIGSMSRLNIGSYSGSTIMQGEVTDVALTSEGLEADVNKTASFQAQDIVYRKISGKLNTYFVKGMSFLDRDTGFIANKNIAIYMKGDQGKVITTTDTEVKISYPYIKDVIINNNVVSNIESGQNWVKVKLPKGSHKLTLTTYKQ